MRFLHVNHRYAPYVGGSERYMQEVSEWLSRCGHDVSLLTSNASDLEYFWDSRRRAMDAPRYELINGVHVERIPVRHFPGSTVVFRGSRRLMGEASRLPLPHAPFDVLAMHLPWMPDLSQRLRQLGPLDLVHATNLGLEGLAVHAYREARKRDVPFILTPFIHMGQASDRIARRYVSMPHHIKLLQDASIVITMTEFEASFVKSLGIDPLRIRVSGVGIEPAEVTGGDADRFRGRHGLKGSLVGTAGALAFEKGSHDLVMAVAALRRRGHDVELVLAGPTLQQFEQWFAGLSEESRGGIHLLGFIDAQEKRDMLAALDILTMPSRTESFGIAYLEGWANRKPVLAANAGAVPELVQPGETGMLVEFGDVDAIADEILNLLSDTEKAGRMGDRGHELTMSSFTWKNVLTRMSGAYSSALGYDLPGTYDDE